MASLCSTGEGAYVLGPKTHRAYRHVFRKSIKLATQVPKPKQKSLPPGVLCKRRGILYFAGELARIIGGVMLRHGNVCVSIWLRRKTSYELTPRVLLLF